MTKYEQQKKQAREGINHFDLSDNLFYAIEAFTILGRILLEEGFDEKFLNNLWKKK